MDLSRDDKIHHIHHNILNEKDNKYYAVLNSLIEKYDLEHSTNMNGIFLNLTTIDDEIIDDIYLNFIDSEDINGGISVIQPIEPIKLLTTEHTKLTKHTKDKFIMEKFDKYILQQSIINLSI